MTHSTPKPRNPWGSRYGRKASKHPLDGAAEHYDLAVIGSGLGGLTAANRVAQAGYKVALVEQHMKLGGLATWFKRKGGHIFDVSRTHLLRPCNASPGVAQSLGDSFCNLVQHLQSRLHYVTKPTPKRARNPVQPNPRWSE